MKVRIRKDGREIGPFDEQVVIAMLDAGELSADDLAMTQGLNNWTPLGQIVVREQTFSDRVAVLAGDAEHIAIRIRDGFGSHPVIFGTSGLIIGCLVMFLSQWPILLYGPFILITLAAAFVLVRRSFLLGAILLAVGMGVPGFLWHTIHQRPTTDDVSVPPTQLKYTPERPPVASATPTAAVLPVNQSNPSPEPAASAPKPVGSAQTSNEKLIQSKPVETPLPHPQASSIPTVAADTASSPAPTAQPFAPKVTSQQQAVLLQMFPQLGVKGSPLNQKYVAEFNRLKTENPSFFNDKTWPLLLAQQCADALSRDSAPIAPPANTPVADPPKPLSDQPGDALQLATVYQNDAKAADAVYYGRRLTISGAISRIMSPESPTTVALVYLKTGSGLPLVKVELNKMEKYRGKSSVGYYYITKNGFDLRVRDESVLEVHSVDTVKNRWTDYYSYFRSHTTSGQWSPIISNGDVIKVLGTCDGKKMDVVLTNADLIQ